MATVPLSGTNIALYSGIPFGNDYKHTRWFDSLADQLNWFASQTHVATFANATFQRINGNPILSVQKSVDELWSVNYISFQNADYAKVFYGFVTELEYVQKNTTYIHFQIDVLQTWRFDMNFQPSFVAREHCKQFDDSGFPLVYTLDEGLNYGTEYNVVSAQQYRPSDDVYYLVCCAKKTMHSGMNKYYYGSLNGIPQLMVYYIMPFRLDGTSPATNIGNVSGLADFCAALYTQDDAVNNIVSLYITDCLPHNPVSANGYLTFDTNNYQFVTLANQLNGGDIHTIFVTDMNYVPWIWDAGMKYTGFTPQAEAKLNSYPYRLIELTDLRGNSITIKPEYINSHDLVINISSSLGTENKVAYTVKDYLNTGLADDGDKVKINMQNSLISQSPNDVPIMTDMLGAFLQGNRNSLKNTQNKIAWNGAFGALGNAMSANPVGFISGAGNAYYEMEGLNAKIKDIDNTPPSVSNLGGNTYFDYGNGLTGLWIIKKEITPEYQKKLTDFFNMYGYKLNEVKIPNFHTRQNWNYVKTVGCIIRGNFNNDDLDELKNVFNNGITLWHTDDIGNYGLSNGVI